MSQTVPRQSSQLDWLDYGINIPIEWRKEDDGSYFAWVEGQNWSATGASEIEAANNLQSTLKDRFTKGEVTDTFNKQDS